MIEKDFNLCIIIPAFNEEKKLDLNNYRHFLLQHENIALVFVNDGSTDKTAQLLSALALEFSDHCFYIANEKNLGKAETVRNGMLWALSNIRANKMAFLDADLSTSFEECIRVSQSVNGTFRFSFASRILTVDSNIQRKAYRHYIGRVIATAISNILKLKVYDTQCGCKVFDRELAENLFNESFISKWLFDVELFFRTMQYLGRENITKIIHEEPIHEWIDRGKSSVKLSYFWLLWLDLWKIRSRYRGI